MADTQIQLEIVSAEKSLFSGAVKHVLVSGELGDLGIAPGHTALLSPLKPGHITFTQLDGEAASFYISGGLLEVQPDQVTVLADTCVRGDELDASKAQAAKEAAKAKLSESHSGADYAQALTELAQASAQIRMIKELRKGRQA